MLRFMSIENHLPSVYAPFFGCLKSLPPSVSEATLPRSVLCFAGFKATRITRKTPYTPETSILKANAKRLSCAFLLFNEFYFVLLYFVTHPSGAMIQSCHSSFSKLTNSVRRLHNLELLCCSVRLALPNCFPPNERVERRVRRS